jgi:hypothetical protein
MKEHENKVHPQGLLHTFLSLSYTCRESVPWRHQRGSCLQFMMLLSYRLSCLLLVPSTYSNTVQNYLAIFISRSRCARLWGITSGGHHVAGTNLWIRELGVILNLEIISIGGKGLVVPCVAKSKHVFACGVW